MESVLPSTDPVVTLARRGYALHAVAAPGEYSLALTREIFAAIVERLRTEPAWGIVLDARALTGHLSLADRFFLGVHLAHLDLHTPLAIIAQARLMDPGRFGEFVAASRGLTVRGFREEQAAYAWLAERMPVEPRSGP
jgi:hypothetical protein